MSRPCRAPDFADGKMLAPKIVEMEQNVSVRKRSWAGGHGETKEAWIVDYRDQQGARHIQTFARKRDADAYHASVAVDVRAGTHTAHSKSLTVTEAGWLWIESGEAAKLERTTLEQYRQHLTLHIAPMIGTMKLANLTSPMVRALEDRLRADRSGAMVRKILGSLGSILADAQERGLVGQNVVRGLRIRRRRGEDRHADKRKNGKLKVGIDIPTPAEVRAIPDQPVGVGPQQEDEQTKANMPLLMMMIMASSDRAHLSWRVPSAATAPAASLCACLSSDRAHYFPRHQASICPPAAA